MTSLLTRVLLSLLLAAALLPAQAQVLRIGSALAAEGDGSSFPAGVVSRIVALPDDWAETRPGRGGPVWYRVGFTADRDRTPRELTALYIENACTTVSVYLNAQLVHGGDGAEPAPAGLCGHPLLVALPAALIAPALNAIDIKVTGQPLAEVGSRLRAGSLSALQIGPRSALAATHSRQTLLAVTLPQALDAMLVLLGAFMFVLGFVNRRESHLAYFGALSIGWAIVDAAAWLQALPLSNAVVEFLLCSTMPFIALAGVQFLLRSARWRHRLIDRLLPLQCALMPLSLVAAGPSRVHLMAGLWTAVLALEVLAATAFYLGAQRNARGFRPMAATLAVVALAALVEWFCELTGARPATARLVQLAVPLMFVVLGLRLVQQHGRTLQEAELGKSHLEQRVREASAEIERNFRQLAELRVDQITERERKRIAADLHDDLGAKLLTIVHTSDSERISTLAREALEEMRLSVRGLTGKPVRLADALGDWRAEVVSRLAQAGVAAEWSAPEELAHTLSARAYVQTTRILREATSNIIKHSGASNCSVVSRVDDGDFQVVVQDNGNGISLEVDGRLDRGHGMASMKHRAKQLQGQCLVESGPGYGTVIRLTVPLERALEAQPQVPMSG